MIQEPTNLPGVFLLRQAVHHDERGSFVRIFDAEQFAAFDLCTQYVQVARSTNRLRGTLRGLHFQIEPFAEIKLVRCTKGEIFDVVVDLRPASQTYGEHHVGTLNANAASVLYIPQGCAHGFLTLSDDAEIEYLISAPYKPELGRGVHWKSPSLAIAWPFEPAVVSHQDQQWPEFLP